MQHKFICRRNVSEVSMRRILNADSTAPFGGVEMKTVLFMFVMLSLCTGDVE
jgi:hypothetical protein